MEEARDCIDRLEQFCRDYYMFLVKIKRHKAWIYSLLWHIEVVELDCKVNNSPFDSELSSGGFGILSPKNEDDFIKKLNEAIKKAFDTQ